MSSKYLNQSTKISKNSTINLNFLSTTNWQQKCNQIRSRFDQINVNSHESSSQNKSTVRTTLTAFIARDRSANESDPTMRFIVFAAVFPPRFFSVRSFLFVNNFTMNCIKVFLPFPCIRSSYVSHPLAHTWELTLPKNPLKNIHKKKSLRKEISVFRISFFFYYFSLFFVCLSLAKISF